MGYAILTPRNSFVRFDGELPENHCIFGQQQFCLPMFDNEDVYFQFTVQADTSAEADALCSYNESGIEIGLVRECIQAGFDLEFTEQPDRYRISPTQVLYNWAHGFPGMTTEFSLNECFYIRVIILGVLQDCSNCFQRIGNDCFTSVIEYGNDESAFGFNYCAAGEVESSDTTSCDPTIITFVNKTTLSLPYTAGLQSLYGPMPTVQVWIYDGGGNLVNMGIQATFDTYPPTLINFDFGGLASGVITIR